MGSLPAWLGHVALPIICSANAHFIFVRGVWASGRTPGWKTYSAHSKVVGRQLLGITCSTLHQFPHGADSIVVTSFRRLEEPRIEWAGHLLAPPFEAHRIAYEVPQDFIG